MRRHFFLFVAFLIVSPASPALAGDNYLIQASHESIEGKMIAAQFDESSALCLSQLGDDRYFVLDLISDDLWLLDSASEQKAIVTPDAIHSWHLAFEAFRREQKELLEEMLADPSLPAELRDLLTQPQVLPHPVPEQRTWKSIADPDARTIGSLSRLQNRLAQSASLFRRLFGLSAERLSPLACLVDPHQVPFSVVQNGDGLPPIQFTLTQGPFNLRWREWSIADLPTLATQGLNPLAPDKIDE